MRQLDARKRDLRYGEGLEAEHGIASLLDRSVVLLDRVVQILAGAYVHEPPTATLSARVAGDPASQRVSSTSGHRFSNSVSV
jgi:hypothetical protein